MADIVRIGKNGEITVGKMTRLDEMELYGSYKPSPPGHYLERRREMHQQLLEKLRLAEQPPEDGQ